MTDLLYQWPSAARFGRRVPKEKFYEHASVNTALREKFISEVDRVFWAYDLAQATINLAGTDEVPDVAVFQVDAKEADVSEPVLSTIDKSIPRPIIFEVNRDVAGVRETRMVASHKQLGAGATKISQYFSTGWQPADTERHPLPTAITLPALYAALLEPLANVEARPGEGMSEVADRLKTVSKLEREIKTLERKLRTEKQFNRKVELRRTLKTKQAQLEQQR
ncbi:hypothetical protein CFAL_03815 [Corynebacterium falsenii DSM 44353]|uniref:DUF4391 domain-containing protein n=1 Tax=Corynebacterium falsenii TaxID=108486 RepID=UPI0003E942AF|nr:DUF4391 domain-containing protein [Corynebacterium falsenii]AHI02830.1 hypothetical protein CFAL_03815 [Corynebacterium falsenii DSM 44353]UBI05620.1 DUF4391 domain-containing protein [Corynebacterium falsenii]